MSATPTADPQVQAQLAVRLAVEYGFYVFPVDHPTATKYCTGVKTREHDPLTCTERGKHPCCKWSEYSTNDAERLVKDHYFGGRHAKNIGIDCGNPGCSCSTKTSSTNWRGSAPTTTSSCHPRS